MQGKLTPIRLLVTVLLLITTTQQAWSQCKAKFGFTKSGFTVYFSDSSKAQNHYRRAWLFGDGTHSDSKSPTHTYKKEGSYRVCLAIRDTVTGCKDTFCETVHIKTATAPTCKASFTYLVQGRKVYFTDQSFAKNFYRLEWSFGDGSHGDDKKTMHQYASDSAFKVCLKITDTVTKCVATYCETVHVKANNGCQARYIFRVNDYKVEFVDSSYAANGYIRRFNFGDGTSSKDRSPIHTYTKDTVYKVCLEIVDTVTKCSSNYCETIRVGKTKFKISGKVEGGSNLAIPGKAWLIVFNAKDSSLKAVKKVDLIKDGGNAYYIFTDVEPGTYYVKAALDTSAADYKYYLPTYYGNALKWAGATQIVVNSSNVTGKHILLTQGNNKGGKGFVKGKLSQGANKKEGDPLEDVQVMIIDENEIPVAYTYSDSLGQFSVADMPFGTYQVYAEIPGLVTYPYWVTLTEEHQTEEQIDIRVNSSTIYSINTGIKAASHTAGNLKVYPNPASSQVWISPDAGLKGQASWQIVNLQGQVMLHGNLNLNEGAASYALPTDQLTAGMYILRMTVADQASSYTTRLSIMK